ncbi:MAG: PxKF domain-containing protein [Candidatus Limnocylindrales bacterium]
MSRLIAALPPARLVVVALVAAVSLMPMHLVSPVRAASLGPLTLASVNSAGDASDAQSGDDAVAMSANGRVVAFLSHATNLVAGDANGVPDVFLRDLDAGTTIRITTDGLGGEANNWSYQPSISADDQVVAFVSDASNLVPDDTNGRKDVFVYDRGTGALQRVSVDDAGLEGDGDSYFSSLSFEGRFVVFASHATNFAAVPLGTDSSIYVHDRVTATTHRIPSPVTGDCVIASAPKASPTRSLIVFLAGASDCASAYTTGVYVHDVFTGTSKLASLDASNAPVADANFGSMSFDGRYVTFQSYLPVTPEDTDLAADVFLRDTVLGTTERISVPAGGGAGLGSNGDAPSADYSAISDDGRYVAFHSSATNLIGADTNSRDDVFIRDRSAGTTTRVDVSAEGFQASGCGGCGSDIALSGDGAWIGFTASSAFTTGDTNAHKDVYVRDLRPVATESSSTTANPGEVFTTDTELDGATPADPIETSVTSPAGGTISIDESPDPGTYGAPSGYAFFGGSVSIEAPPASPQSPLSIEFLIDPVVHGGLTAADISIFRDGLAIADCDPLRFDAGWAVPDPCVVERSGGGSNDARIRVLTSHASEWNLGFIPAGSPSDDTTAPQVEISSPVNGSTYLLGQSVLATYACDDGAGSGVATCDGPVPAGSPIDTASIGNREFTVTTSDVAGNVASASVSYAVIYPFSGFFQPVDNGILNVVKAGSGVPIKFSLGGNRGLGIFEAGYPQVTPIACPGGPTDAVETTVATSTASLSYDTTTGRYTYVFKTQKPWTGTCRRLELRFIDGTSHTIDFRFTK